MSFHRILSLAAATAVALTAWTATPHAQLVVSEPGFLGTTISSNVSKQIQVGIGPDTCLYYGSDDGLVRKCGLADPGTVCDPDLPFPVGIAFSTGGSFGSAMYVADFAIGNIYRSPGCSPGTLFATIATPGAIAFPPAGSPYGDFLYACEVGSGPLYRVNAAGAVSTWLALQTAYMAFGPAGSWGSGLYATQSGTPPNAKLVHVFPSGAITTLASGFWIPEGFDWGFDGDMFATDAGFGRIMRVKSDGTATLFATLPGAADVAFRPTEQALYVVSNQQGLFRIVRHNTSDVPGGTAGEVAPSVSPNPARGDCSLRFTTGTGGMVRVQVVDVAGRVIRRLGDAWRPAGIQSLRWDGRDERGAQVGAGIYFAHVQAPGASQTARVTIVR